MSSDITEAEFTRQRHYMVQEQIVRRKTRSSDVLDAMRSVPRHRFVPEALQKHAYEDAPLPIGHDQTISQPYIVALMSEQAQIGQSDIVLEIGTGSGYQAAVLAELASKVYSIEIVEVLGLAATTLLRELAYNNIVTRIGDGGAGWPDAAPFNAILVTAAPDTVPQALVDQLSEGGRMLIPVGSRHQKLVLFEKREGQLFESKITDVRFVPMVGNPNKNP